MADDQGGVAWLSGLRQMANRGFWRQMIPDLLITTKAYSLFRPVYGGMGAILMFHRVMPEHRGPRLSDNKGAEITPQYLEAAITYYRDNGYAIVSLDELYEMMRRDKWDKRFVCFTFDDGYADNLIHAYPIFKKHSVPFAIYVPIGFPNRSAVIWWYLLEEIILAHDHLRFETDNGPLSFPCRTQKEKEETFARMRDFIIDSGKAEYLPRLNRIFRPYLADLHRKTGEIALNREQLKEISQDPDVTIGAHTLSHLALNRLSANEARDEILRSKEILESWLGRKVEHFAYPFGSRAEVGKREFGIVRSCGFKTATTTRPGNIFRAHREYAESLPRIAFSEKQNDTRYFELLLSGTIPALKNGFRRVITA